MVRSAVQRYATFVVRCAASDTTGGSTVAGGWDQSITLDAGDLRGVLDLASGLATAPPGELGVQEVLRQVAGLVGCDRAYWTRLRTAGAVRRLEEIGLPPSSPVPEIQLPNQTWDAWVAHRHEHPIMSGRWQPVVAVSDVYHPRALRETWLYQEMLRLGGVRDEIGVHLSHSADELQVVFLSRLDGGDFSDRDHLVLRLLRPHLDAALRRLTRPPPRLTRREVDVLRLVRDGLTDAQIACRLAISEETVGKHLQHIYARSGAQSRVQVLTLCATALD